MKRLYTLYIIIAATFATFTSCDGFQISDNGDLDGMWKLVKVDSLSYGITPKTVDYTYETIFWSVQSDLLNVTDIQKRHLPCFLRFKLDGDRLFLFDPYIDHSRKEPDEKLSDPAMLQPFGINNLEEEFEVETLNRKEMVLYSSSLCLHFKRY